MRRTLTVLVLACCLLACKEKPADSKKAQVEDSLKTAQDTTLVDGHPAWIQQGNIYEVNVRQYTPEGTFKAFQPHIERLKDMGVQTLWFMPIYPIGIKDRKGVLGSYYAIRNYTDINPEFGTLEDFKALVSEAHSSGMKVIIDWVANHTSTDHPWLTTHPDFYVKDKKGQPVSPFDWTDTRKLNYKNPVLQDSMIASMEYWLKVADVDGFRCDVAEEVPKEFWTKCIARLRQDKKVFMLAEGDKPWLHEAGFDETYTWSDFAVMKRIAAGAATVSSLDSIVSRHDSAFPATALRLYFTSNHDENSWNKADYGTMPGLVHAPFAVLTQTMKQSVPLIYSGQEEPVTDSISFFYKDTIRFGKFERRKFYETLLKLRSNNKALAANAGFRRLRTGQDSAMYCFERNKDGNKVLVILNLSSKGQTFTWRDQPSDSVWNNVFLFNREPVYKGFSISPWGYAVYTN
jgi:alpha-amylase